MQFSFGTSSKPLPTVANQPIRYLTVQNRSAIGHQARFKLSDGSFLFTRRYLPLGAGDEVAVAGNSLFVFAKRDAQWVEVSSPWRQSAELQCGDLRLPITFKEIETEEEDNLFQQLRQFHYRGGGGAGRTVPIIATVDTDDLPGVIGFIELSSSMIANTARKKFFSSPYREDSGLFWNDWDRATSRSYSSLICRISRFVIHPELRGLGVAGLFTEAVREYAKSQWHYGGYRPRFLEITADMLRYYPFIGPHFVFMGETEGNEHRVSKDMHYLVKKSMSDKGAKGMPQGGGGIMSLQRGYATTLLNYMVATSSSLEETVSRLQYDPSLLEQSTWEALHKLNRRPKPCYVSGLTSESMQYISARSVSLSPPKRMEDEEKGEPRSWQISDLSVDVEAEIAQTKEGRILQDAFGFVGASLQANVIQPISFKLATGQVTLVSGASGSGKSLMLLALMNLLGKNEDKRLPSGLRLGGSVTEQAGVSVLRELDPSATPLDYLGRASLERLLRVTARCGLAEPQLLVRPIWSLSSGQQYRLQVALTMLDRPDVVLIDNFCESLDRFSARAVWKGLQTLTRELNVVTVVATAAYDRVAGFLMADQTIMLRRGDQARVRRGGRGEVQETYNDEQISDPSAD